MKNQSENQNYFVEFTSNSNIKIPIDKENDNSIYFQIDQLNEEVYQLKLKNNQVSHKFEGERIGKIYWKSMAILFMVVSALFFGLFLVYSILYYGKIQNIESKEPFLKPNEIKISKNDTTYIYSRD